MSSVRVRIAPSPTGFLHVGTARTALFNWLFARHNEGTFILRIEDTDVARSSEEVVEGILESLKWLGLDWDEGPYFQSQRSGLYPKAADQLLQRGRAYYCYCPPEDLARRKEGVIQKGKQWKYDRRCLSLSETEKRELAKEGVPKALRFLIPDGKTSYEDGVHGKIERDNGEIEDFILLRSNGMPTYNFACVVDDVEMKISHVIRGDDHISNTFKQILLYKVLEIEPPEFYHLPLILGEDRSKLSKRHGAVSVMDYRDQGYLPETFFNFLALLGWYPGNEKEFLTREEMIAGFTFDRVRDSGAIFDVKKLEWMNGQYINKLQDKELLEAVLPFLKNSGLVDEGLLASKREWILQVIHLLKERAKRLTDFVELGKFFFSEEVAYDSEAVKKHFLGDRVGERLQVLQDSLSKLEDFSLSGVETTFRGLATQLQVPAAKLIHPTRVALTGCLVGPSLFELVQLMGKERTIARLTQAIRYIENQHAPQRR